MTITVTEFNDDWTETVTVCGSVSEARDHSLARSRCEYVDHITVTDSTKLKPLVFKKGKEL